MKDVGTWLHLAARALVLERSAYRDIIANGRMTGPALLLGLFFSALGGYFRADASSSLVSLIARPVSWLIGVLAIYIAGRLLTRKGTFTQTLRGQGFAQVVHIIDLLALVPVLAPVALFLSTLLLFIASWMGAAVAHQTHGWRTLIFPVIMLIIIILIPVLVLLMLGSVVLSLDSILAQLGLSAGG